MVTDPYKILGISQGATQEEIKKAYRRKAKEYHPDLHPNDPDASQKMNEINEAYDMLMNPQKYKARQAQQQGQSRYGGYAGGQRTANGQNTSGNYRGFEGWSGEFGDFDFGDIFGYGFGRRGGSMPGSPQPEAGDSADIRWAINAINGKKYQEAIGILTSIPSFGRNARWYYLSALANHGLGNTVQAIEHMQRASQLDPNNSVYHQLLQQFRQSEQTYEEYARGFNMNAANMQRLCFGCLAMQCFCGPFGCFGCM